MAATVSINGKTYSGSSITITDGDVIVDGVRQNDKVSGVVEVRVMGTLHHLSSHASVSCWNVTGNVEAAGSVNCDDVGGSVTAGGSVNCDDIRGDVRAGGSVHRS